MTVGVQAVHDRCKSALIGHVRFTACSAGLQAYLLPAKPCYRIMLWHKCGTYGMLTVWVLALLLCLRHPGWLAGCGMTACV